MYATGGVEAASRIFEQRLDVAGAPRALVEGVWASISRDSRTLFVINDVRATGHLSRRTIGSDGSIGSAETLVPDLDVDALAASPDGGVAAIVHHGERDRLEISLIALDGTARQRVTTDGGTQPEFSADGRTLYYLVSEPAANGQRARRLMRVPVTSTTPLQIGKPEAVFGGSSGAIVLTSRSTASHATAVCWSQSRTRRAAARARCSCRTGRRSCPAVSIAASGRHLRADVHTRSDPPRLDVDLCSPDTGTPILLSRV